jgi:hypothetical protein
MQALNHLVARSIVDPSVVISFNAGRINDVLSECDFAPEMRANLAQLEANSFAEYAMYAYRLVKAAEQAEVGIRMPSPMEGLLTSDSQADKEQVA